MSTDRVKPSYIFKEANIICNPFANTTPAIAPRTSYQLLKLNGSVATSVSLHVSTPDHLINHLPGGGDVEPSYETLLQCLPSCLNRWYQFHVSLEIFYVPYQHFTFETKNGLMFK
jgi:hypothetical protein